MTHGALIGGSTLSGVALWGAFLLGLTGGFGHCLAMCGPFVAAASLAEGRSCAVGAAVGGGGSRAGAGRFQLAYHTGRLLTYALLGAVLGLLGGVGALASLGGPFSPTSVTRWLKLGAGVAMVAIGAVLLVAWARGRGAKLPEPTAAITRLPWFSATVGRLAGRSGWWGLPLGGLMGLLPCMPLLPVELAALATGVPLYGALTMLAFGIGTLPALVGFGAASGLVGRRARGWLVPAAAALVLVLGAVTLAQGLSLAGSL